MQQSHKPMGFAGSLAKKFLHSKLTPLFVVVSILLGVYSVFMTPKEEEPQIKVPMIDVAVMAPGLGSEEVEKRVTNLLEREFYALTKVKHIYSVSLENYSLVTVRFDVGEDLETSLVKVHHRMMNIKERLPSEAMAPQIKSYTIDDVSFYNITFFSKELSADQIRYQVVPLVKRLQSIEGVADYTIIGGERKVLKILPQVERLNALGITLMEMKDAVEKSNTQYMVNLLRQRNPEMVLMVGSFIASVEDVKQIPIGRRFGRTVTLGEVATVTLDFDHQKHSIFQGRNFEAAITVTFSKKQGTNATLLAQELQRQLKVLSQSMLDPRIQSEITRDYGATAKEKSDELIKHLIIATISVMILIALTMGLRVSMVVAIAIPVTLAMTLLIYYLMGYTLNRVTLFALIFSIGILVDDAIVVVENIYRHLQMKLNRNRDRASVIAQATDEVGNPTILATFTVIMAIMPMAFVGGLMGPYMRPIPVGGSMAMLFSLIIAFMIIPWAANFMIQANPNEDHSEHKSPLLDKIFRPFLIWATARLRHSVMIFSAVFLLLFGAMSLVAFKMVKVKMLPFDNKSEFQVLIDLPPGTTLEQSQIVAKQSVEYLYRNYPEIRSIQTYVGTAAPYNFSGMVKHTFMRNQSYMIDLQINLLDKHARKRQSHDLVKLVRQDLTAEIAKFQKGETKVKMVEIPPGPPVMATMLAEIYAPNRQAEQMMTEKVTQIFSEVEGLVEVENSYVSYPRKLFYEFDRVKGSQLGVPQSYANATFLMGMSDLDLYLLHLGAEEEPVYMRLSLPLEYRSDDAKLLSLLVPSMDGDKVPLANLYRARKTATDLPIHHKDLKNVSYVMGEVVGAEESPVYAIAKLNERLKSIFREDQIFYAKTPNSSGQETLLKWDGEMDITVEVFRDLGIAFAIAVVLIMILVIGWYNSFILPLIIVVPIPLTLIGILPGHWLFDSFFTATSMIGMMAGAGITVRNSIILVDFIQERVAEGIALREAIIESTVVRFRPILLTALAVIVAGVVILFDPIFQGLAISLMTGSIASALLSIPLVPVLYYWVKVKSGVENQVN